MHVRVRLISKSDTIVVVESKLTKIEQFRRIIQDKLGVEPQLQLLLYGGKLLENGYTFHDYNIKLNDVIQLMVKIQPEEDTNNYQDKTEIKTNCDKDKSKEDTTKNVVYQDSESILYVIGDLVDVRNPELGAWFEGKIVRIVYEPSARNLPDLNSTSDNLSDKTANANNFEKDYDSENKPPSEATNGESSKPKKGIAKYFSISPKTVKKKQPDKESKEQNSMETDANLLFKVQMDSDEEDSNIFCKLKELRPRARTVIDVQDVKVGQKVMINYNVDEPQERGYWYDFKVSEIKKLRAVYELTGTLYLGPDAVPQDDTKVRVQDKIFAIEEPVPVAQRIEEYKTKMITPPEKRSAPLNCLTCRDDEDELCKDCGCYLCSGKEFPEKIVLCDECNKGYHMICLTPALTELPEEDWYCPSCKRDPNDVIAPGAAKQTKKTSATKSTRDWGRGMACVGKTKTCAMPANHFGPIPGIEVGMCWRFRIQLSESGVHRPPVSGIHGRDVEGAYSIVLSGGYEDDVDYGNEFTYTGSGGRDLSGNKRTAEQSCDQTLTRENKALARNCAVKQVSEEGGDAGDKWRNGRPVRVVRSYKMLKHFPKYAPKEGIRYDGIYKVVKYYPEKGLSGYRVWKYLLRRDDPNPAPWEEGVKEYPIIYPDGYLEAEAQKKALKEKNVKNAKGKGTKKRALRESNQTTESESEASPPIKKRKTIQDEPKTKKKGRPSKKSLSGSPKSKAGNLFKDSSIKKEKEAKEVESETKGLESALSPEEREAINADTLNVNLWQECLDVCDTRGKKYPDGSLEAEAEKKALKEKNVKNAKGKGTKKRALRESNQTTESESEASPPIKKRKTIQDEPKTKKKASKKSLSESSRSKAGNLFKDSSVKKEKEAKEVESETKGLESALSPEEREAINADTLNVKLWQECLVVCDTRGKKEFVEYLSQMFLCIICQEVAASPVTTPCLHNFCMACIKLAFKSTGTQTCPCCRYNLAKYEPETNERLKTALRSVMAGYDAGKK